MLHIFACLFLSLVHGGFTQEKKFTFSGIITSCASKKPAEGIPVAIIVANGPRQEVLTDKNGKYAFTFFTEQNAVSVLLTYNSKTSGKNNDKLGSEIYRETLERQGSAIIEHDLCLKPGK